MKNLNYFFILLVLLISGCSYHPSTFNGTSTIADTNENKVQNDYAFKYTFIRLLPTYQQGYLVKSIEKQTTVNESINSVLQRNGNDILATSAMGYSPTSNTGAGVTLGLGVVADIVQANSGDDNTSGIFVSDAWLGQKGLNEKDASNIARQKTIDAIKETAIEFGYSIECVYFCEKHNPVFELTDQRGASNKNEYRPYKLTWPTDLSALVNVKNHKTLNKLYPNKYSMQSHQWQIYLWEPLTLTPLKSRLFSPVGIVENKEKAYKAEQGFIGYHVNKNKNGDEYIAVESARSLLRTPLGRDIARSLSKKLPNWYMGGEYGVVEYAVYQGEVYKLEDMDSFEEFHGQLTIN